MKIYHHEYYSGTIRLLSEYITNCFEKLVNGNVIYLKGDDFNGEDYELIIELDEKGVLSDLLEVSYFDSNGVIQENRVLCIDGTENNLITVVNEMTYNVNYIEFCEILHIQERADLVDEIQKFIGDEDSSQ